MLIVFPSKYTRLIFIPSFFFNLTKQLYGEINSKPCANFFLRIEYRFFTMGGTRTVCISAVSGPQSQLIMTGEPQTCS